MPSAGALHFLFTAGVHLVTLPLRRRLGDIRVAHPVPSGPKMTHLRRPHAYVRAKTASNDNLPTERPKTHALASGLAGPIVKSTAMPHLTCSVGRPQEQIDLAHVRDVVGPRSEIYVAGDSAHPTTELWRFPKAPGRARGRCSAGNTAARSPSDADRWLSRNADNSGNSSLPLTRSNTTTRQPDRPQSLPFPSDEMSHTPLRAAGGTEPSSYERGPRTIAAPDVRIRTTTPVTAGFASLIERVGCIRHGSGGDAFTQRTRTTRDRRSALEWDRARHGMTFISERR